MAYVGTKEMLRYAQSGKYAIGAFNAENMEMVQAIVSAAEKMSAPVIIQTTPGTLKYADPAVFVGMISRIASGSKVPIALHLDHGNSFDLAEYCIRQGYTSVMIDGSQLPYEENVSLTRRVVEAAKDVPVEAELGTVGGKEDTLSSAGIAYTDPEQGAAFVQATGIFSFAPAIGTAHGVYASEPKLDIDRLSQISGTVSVPLVLHGTSGVSTDMVQTCIRHGICKVNYATDLRIAFTNAVRSFMRQDESAIDPKKFLSKARAAVEARVCELIEICGSAGKA